MKRVVTVQDLSCLGKCSLTVALPVLSAMGCSCAVLPTAVLSTHTAFPHPYLRDLTADMRPILEHWFSVGAEFDAILVGYLSNPKQVEAVAALWERFPALRILDPAMGDSGKLYSGITDAHVDAVRQLLSNTDLLIPNVTEACLLTGTPYENANHLELLEKLQKLGVKQVVLTGVSLENGKTGFMTGDGDVYQTTAIPGHYHGTGDLFAAVCTGSLLQGKSLTDAATAAAGFVEDTILATPKASPFGLHFEPCLPSLSN